ncbi:MAG TPA: SHOCT domain-containing protein, partial [Solirubrobacterales bacterium]|nr:SHOCT domain-containing protein [Solirubrobacterales bacterium]
ISTEVVVTDQFFLADPHGNVESFQLTGFEAAVGTGHVVSVAWAIKKFRRSGPYFMVYDHTTRRAFFNDKVLTKTFTFPYPTLYIALLCIMLMPLPIVIFFALLSEWWQIPRFQKAGVQPLLSALESRNLSFVTPQPSAALPATSSTDAVGITPELERIAAMRDAGVLSEAEFEAAKAKLLAQ